MYVCSGFLFNCSCGSSGVPVLETLSLKIWGESVSLKQLEVSNWKFSEFGTENLAGESCEGEMFFC